MDLEPFDASSPAEVLDGWHRLDAETALETLPGLEPPQPVESLLEVESDMGNRRWGLVARDGGEVIGAIEWAEPLLEDLDEVYAWMCVTGRRRREGVGGALLAEARALLRAAGRARMFSSVPIGGPAERFALGHGARVIQVELCNALELSSVDHTELAQAARPTAAYALRRWRGPCPPELADAFASAHAAMDDAPRGDDPHEEASWTAARVHDQEARWLRAGIDWLTAVAVHEATGDVAGYTQLLLTGRRSTAIQEDTGVVRAHRGHSLGMALKASNLLALRDAAPHVRTVVTWNAESNAHMLAVNTALGFQVNSRWNEVALEL